VVGERVHQVDFATCYKYERSENGIEVPIELHYREGSVRLRAKVDTGAASCFFQRAYAEELGIQVEAGHRETFSTAAGYFEAFGHHLEIRCLGHKSVGIVYFGAATTFSRNVLGRMGWLDQHKLGLIDSNSTLYLDGSLT
jgi:hypothetical protein